jgi:sarcosine oxidase subunit alpha
MTCRVRAAEGLRIETQNVVGSRDTDLLRVADWFFPEGMNHHELFAGVPGVQGVMQGLARRVAGLGRLPKAPAPMQAAARRSVDVLVVGTGPAGMASALELTKRGRRVELVDDDFTWGGSVRAMPASRSRAFAPLLNAFGDAAARSLIVARTATTAAGVYGDDVLIASDTGVEVVTARTLVFATGVHDGVALFEGNDVPGVMSARAACRLLSHGVVIGTKVVVAAMPGGGPWGEAYASAHREAKLVHGTPLRVRGKARVKGTTIETPKGESELACDALLVDAAGAPAYELCAQAGAELAHQARGYLVRTTAGGKIRTGTFAIGEVAGTPLEAEAMTRAALALAEAAVD